MALQLIKTPSSMPNIGIFNLPEHFDIKRYAAEWVEEGQIEYKRQRQPIIGTNYTADGWEIWKVKSADKPNKVKTSNGKTYVLMCRDRKLQDQINALCGDASKKMINREVMGETALGESVSKGIITDDRSLGRTSREVEESVLPLNVQEIGSQTHGV